MLALSSEARIFFCRDATDMRKGFESLSVLVESYFQGHLISGSYFVFLNRRRNTMKVLYWDNDGLALWHKRLEQGTFSPGKDATEQLSRRDFFMLLEGIIPQRIKKRFQMV